jgi:hypothetical protein
MLKSITTCQRKRHVIDITKIVCITKEEEKEHNLNQTNKHQKISLLKVGNSTILASTSFELIHSNQSDSIYIMKMFHILSMYQYIYNLKL